MGVAHERRSHRKRTVKKECLLTDIFAIQCNMSILRRFKGKFYSSLYSCEEFNIANRLSRKIKRRLNFISQLFVSALKTRYTVFAFLNRFQYIQSGYNLFTVLKK